MELEAAISNDGAQPVKVTVVANAYRLRHHDHQTSIVVAPHRTIERRWSLAFSGGWYDFTVTADAFERRFAGRMETGQDSVSDPAMGMTVTEENVLSESVEAVMATTEPQSR